MNDLRVPITGIVIVLVVFGGWLLYVHQQATPPAQQTSAVATTTASTTIASEQATQNPAPVSYPDESTVTTNIAGTWQSGDDPNYSVVITADGKWTDRYKSSDASSSVAQTGSYTLFTSANPPSDFTDPVVSGVVYLKLVEGSDTYFYSVLLANGTQLQLSYLARGNTLSFVKVY